MTSALKKLSKPSIKKSFSAKYDGDVVPNKAEQKKLRETPQDLTFQVLVKEYSAPNLMPSSFREEHRTQTLSDAPIKLNSEDKPQRKEAPERRDIGPDVPHFEPVQRKSPYEEQKSTIPYSIPSQQPLPTMQGSQQYRHYLSTTDKSPISQYLLRRQGFLELNNPTPNPAVKHTPLNQQQQDMNSFFSLEEPIHTLPRVPPIGHQVISSPLNTFKQALPVQSESKPPVQKPEILKTEQEGTHKELQNETEATINLWQKIPEESVIGFYSANEFVVGKNVKIGPYAVVDTVIAQRLEISGGTVKQAIVFDEVKLLWGIVDLLLCSPKVTLYSTFSTIHEKQVLNEIEMNNLAILYTSPNSNKSKETFPWGKFPEKESANFKERDLIVASNVDVGAACVKTVITKKLNVDIGSVQKAYVFDMFEIGIRGHVGHLICLQTTAAFVNFGSITKQEIVNSNEWIKLALKEFS